jgi:hypothetical protein
MIRVENCFGQQINPTQYLRCKGEPLTKVVLEGGASGVSTAAAKETLLFFSEGVSFPEKIEILSVTFCGSEAPAAPIKPDIVKIMVLNNSKNKNDGDNDIFNHPTMEEFSFERRSDKSRTNVFKSPIVVSPTQSVGILCDTKDRVASVVIAYRKY